MKVKLYEDEASVQSLSDAAKKDIAQAANQLDAQYFSSDEGDIESALNRALTVSKRKQKYGHISGDFPNVLLIGEAGTGKSARVRAWARKHNINLFEVRAAGMDETDLGGIIQAYNDVVRRLASTEFDVLDRPNSVLFLDEYNRAPAGVRTNLLELINSHNVPDPRVTSEQTSGQRKLKNFLFTVAAINPNSESYDVHEMDRAELSRFQIVKVKRDKKNYLAYVNDELDDELKQETDDNARLILLGQKSLANTIIPNPLFQFDDNESTTEMERNHYGEAVNPTNSRTFFSNLEACDGTKEDFLAQWNSHCNPDQKNVIETILADYENVEDKATQALEQHETRSDVFKKAETGADRLRKAGIKI